MLKNWNFFCGVIKDPVPLYAQSFVVYKFVCPGCGASYIGKTERTLFERTAEHGWSDKNSAVKIHLDSCDGVGFLHGILSLDDDEIDERQFNNVNSTSI